MRLFWSRGYANASVRDLLKVMKIGEGSFYNLFAGKKELYLECLRRYNDLVTKRRLASLAAGPVGNGFRRFFLGIIDELADPTTPPACLMANSLFSDVLVDSELRDTVQKEYQAFESYARKRLQGAVRSGELRKEFPVRATAAILVTFLQGLFRVYDTVHDRALARQQIDLLLKSLDLGGIS